MPMIYNELGII